MIQRHSFRSAGEITGLTARGFRPAPKYLSGANRACHTTADRGAAHRKSDRHLDDLCGGGFRIYARIWSQSSSTTFLCSDHSRLAHQHRVWLASASDVFSVVVYDRSDERFEFLSALDYSLHCDVYLFASFGASEATICSKRGSPRSGSQKGDSSSVP